MALVGKKLQREEMTQGFRELYKDDVIDLRSLPESEKKRREGPQKFSEFPQEQREIVDALLRGRLPLDKVPKRPPRVIKVFVASTSTDMREEQDALMAGAYPKLREYCRQRYAVDFQAIDMTWGTAPEEHPDPSTVQLYMDTQRQCQRDSMGPTFVALLGQKYGEGVLPVKISAEVYDPLLSAMRQQGDDKSRLLEKWYSKDINAIPNVYILQAPDDILGKDTKSWPEIKQTLTESMSKAAAVCSYEATIDPSFLHALESSVIERELVLGLSNISVDRSLNDQCMSLLRSIDDLHKYLDRDRVSAFCDVTPGTNDVDKEKYGQMESLIKDIALKYLNNTSLLQETISWSDPNGVDATTHKEYLDQLCIQFFNTMRDKIDITMEDHQKDIAGDDLVLEVLQGWNSIQETSSRFHGQEDILEQMMWYILDETDRALVVHGEEGTGKTAILCKAAGLVHDWLHQNDRFVNTTVVFRTCSSPKSSTLRGLLQGLCHQIAYTTEQSMHQVPPDLKGMKQYFKQLIENAEFRGLVVIFLDGLDEMLPNDNAHKLDWLPAKLSKNVKIIVSTSSEQNGILSKLQERISEDSYYINVLQLKSNFCCEVLNSCLKEHGRMLQFNQWHIVQEAFNHCSTPLFLEEVFLNCKMWRSYIRDEDTRLQNTVQASVLHFLDTMEIKHGHSVVSHSLGLLCVSRRGLSEVELEHVLSLDEEVLDEVFENYMPRVRRMPLLALQRLFHDMSGHLVCREVDKLTALFWKHAVMRDVAYSRYNAKSSHLHSLMADFYLGTCGNRKPKPFKFSNTLVKKLRLKNAQSKAIRHVPEQPTVLDTCSTNRVFNIRKLNQLPYHLLKASRTSELNSEVYFRYDWLQSKVCACTVQELIDDYSLVTGKEPSLVADTLKLSAKSISEDPNVLGVEIVGRLLPYYQKCSNIRKLIDQCDSAAVRYSPLLPVWQSYVSPGGPQQYAATIGQHVEEEHDVEIFNTSDTIYVAVKPFDSPCLTLWDVSAAEQRLSAKVATHTRIYPSPDGKSIHMFLENKALQTFHVLHGEMDSEIAFPAGKVGNVAVTQKYLAATLRNKPSPVLIDVEARMVVNKFQYQSQAVGLSRDGRYMVCNTSLSLAVHEIPLLERKCTIQVTSLPVKILFTDNNCRFFVMFQDGSIKSVLVNLIQKRAKINHVISCLEMRDFKLSLSNKLMLVRCPRSLHIIDATTEKRLHSIQSMPAGVFVESLSTFTGVSFTPDESKVVAARQSYLCIWDVETTKPLRVLQPSVCLIAGLYIPNIANTAVTVLADSSMQVWDLNNLDENTHFLNTIVSGSVASMAVSSIGDRVVVTGTRRAEAKVFNLATGTCEHVLQHSDDLSLKLEEVLISPCGHYAVTRAVSTWMDDRETWPLLKDDQLWDLKSGNMVHHGTGNRFVSFSDDDSKIVFFPCRKFDSGMWADTCYDAVVIDTATMDAYLLDLPDGDIIGKPVLTSHGEYLVYVIQQLNVVDDSDPFAPRAANSNGYQVLLCVHSFGKHWVGFKYIDIHSIWSGVNEDDNFIDVQLLNDDHLLLTYAKDTCQLHYREDGTIDRSRLMPKGALVYDIGKDCLVRRIDSMFQPDTDMDTVIAASMRSHFLDRKLRLFDANSENKTKWLELDQCIRPETARLLLDGRYVAALSSNSKEVRVYRTSDSTRIARVFVHGKGEHLETGPEDRTVVVGCSDGRIMTFVLLLESPDHITEIVQHLPSRTKTNSSEDTECMLQQDIDHINQTVNEHKQLSALARKDLETLKSRPPSFREVGEKALLTRELSNVQSPTCSIQ